MFPFATVGTCAVKVIMSLVSFNISSKCLIKILFFIRIYLQKLKRDQPVKITKTTHDQVHNTMLMLYMYCTISYKLILT